MMYKWRPTVLELHKVLNEILHEAVLLRQISLEGHHLVYNCVVLVLECADVRGELLLLARHTLDLQMNPFQKVRGARRWCTAWLALLSVPRYLSLDVLQRVPAIHVELGMSEDPTLRRDRTAR